jgi:competence CoiA-like predicted nuclease
MKETAVGSDKSFGVEDPAIRTVFDTESGVELHADILLTAEEETVMQLRFDVKRLIKQDRAKFLCPECFVPVSLVSMKEARRFYFRHLVEDGSCSAVTRGELSQSEINARKYNGAKESYRHLEMKQWIADSLNASGKFTDIAQEVRWAGPITGAWRKPDVSAMYGDLKVAFEVQLSTTFLDVIAERWNFYQQEGGLVVWVFARSDDERRRLTQDDLFFINNQNAFVVSKETRDASIAASDFLLDCAWSEPKPAHFAPTLKRQRVSFFQLKLDTELQQAYYFDFRSRKAELQAALAEERGNWPTYFEKWWLEVAGNSHSQDDQEDNVREFPANVPVHWNEWGMLNESCLAAYGREQDRYLPVAMLNAFYSAKHGRPVGIRRRHFIEVAHYVVQSYPKYLHWFRRALEVFGRGQLLIKQDRSGRWATKVKRYKHEMKHREARYEVDETHRRLFEWLFPELAPLPQ